MKLKIITIISVLLVLSLGLYWWTQIQSKSASENSAHSGHMHESQQTFICPMHPQIKSKKPGACPICGMDLVSVSDLEDDDEAEENSETRNHGYTEKSGKNKNVDQEPQGRSDFRLTLDKQQLIGVQHQNVERKELFKSIKAPGRVAFDPELYTAQSEYLEALKQWSRVQDSPIVDVKENTRQMIRSSKIRLKVLGLSEAQIRSLAKRGFQSEGLLVGGKDNIVYADVFEIDLPFIKSGQSAQVSAQFLQGKKLPAKVISVDRVIDPETRTAKVRIQLLKSDPAIRPESYVNVTVLSPLGKHLSVPLESIMDTGLETYVFVKKGKRKFEPRRIQVVLETATEAAVVGPLEIDDKVVVGANFLIDSESRLRAVIQQSEVSSSGHNH